MLLEKSKKQNSHGSFRNITVNDFDKNMLNSTALLHTKQMEQLSLASVFKNETPKRSFNTNIWDEYELKNKNGERFFF